MTTVSILAVADEQGGYSYRAVSGPCLGDGKTPGEALDAVASQFDNVESSTLVVVQKHLPDRFFTAEHRNRLEELMSRWRAARNRGVSLAPDEQEELDRLVETELRAAAERTAAMADELTQ